MKIRLITEFNKVKEVQLSDLKNEIKRVFPSVTQINSTLFGRYSVIGFDKIIGYFYLERLEDGKWKDCQITEITSYKF